MKLDSIDGTIWLLVGLVIVFTGLLVTIAKWMPEDSQTFQIVATLDTGFSGALLGRMKPQEAKKPEPEGGPQ